ncbi:hypothetical protein HY642_00375 [Candidatus Woesearchaeota archaeon]|nr:hypothetical protein [Candidatus Woesearchaeota archaeon]
MELDVDKARIYLRYLARTTHRVMGAEHSRKQLDKEIQRLRDIHPTKLQQQVDEVEKRVKDALEKERELAQSHAAEEGVHKKLAERLVAIEQRMQDVQNVHEVREKRARDLEAKIRQRMQNKRERISEAQHSLAMLEAAVKTLQHHPRQAKRVAQIKKRILFLKERIVAMKGL